METEINPEAKKGHEYPVFWVQLTAVLLRRNSQEAYYGFPFKWKIIQLVILNSCPYWAFTFHCNWHEDGRLRQNRSCHSSYTSTQFSFNTYTQTHTHTHRHRHTHTPSALQLHIVCNHLFYCMSYNSDMILNSSEKYKCLLKCHSDMLIC